jgi:hypothetical protein
MAPDTPPPGATEAIYRLKKVRDLPAELTARIDQPPWTSIADFPPMTLVGTSGDKPRHRSRVKACWNDTGVRILWHFEDADVVAGFTGRDEQLWRDDIAEILLAPEGDRTRYYEISFNARGALFDGAIHNPNVKRDDAWAVEPAWNCEGIRWCAIGEGRFNGSARRDRWWAVEAEIPFAGVKVLRPRAGDVWTAGVFRVDNGPPLEWHSWTKMPLRRPGFHQSDRFGLWIFEE